ncbi:acetolactate synthase large subunit [Paraphotobacterium marinum]|uniref:Acetolactate synthase large subunit n=1 Tax=Paraphotobacterium marinum TaxID=1755811 RepID=A0A220VHK6_9GAMM|nr:acetolactate synthase large subunit [Paraphotobacterium marinum]ASK79433.1 acetolactate synthase large subunit [Paraphotobacterium marinum]
MKASDLFLQCLELQGVKTIYGVPGEENADVMISLLDSEIDFITTRHEQTAAFMAEMHGRLTGVPGVCMATLGPGATNLLTGVAQANMDNSPLVAIIGQAETDRLHKESHQNMDSVDMYKPVTKWSVTIRDADSIPEIIAKAFKVATSGIPGAVLIELPEDIAKHDASSKAFTTDKSFEDVGTTTKQIEEVLSLIEQHEKPIILLGDGAVRFECDKELKSFLNHTKLYSAHTFMGKGAVSNLYDRSLHCVGMGMKDLVINAFEESDLVICVGYDMVEYPPSRWNVGKEKTIVHISSDVAEVDKDYIPKIEMIGNIKVILEQVNTILSKTDKFKSISKDQPYFRDQQELIEKDVRSYNDDDAFPMRPKRILHDIRETLKDEDILISDVGAHKMWVARQYGARLPKTVFISNGFCSMGGSIPSAIEAKRLYPEKNVVALCGDGGFMMSIQALATARDLNIPICVIVWEDRHYGLIKWKQEMSYNTSSHCQLSGLDLQKIANSFDCNSYLVDKSENFTNILNNALSSKDKPSVIVVPVDYSENMKLFEHLKNVVK